MPKLLQISLSVTNRSVGGVAKRIGEVAIENGWDSYITYTHQTELAESKSQIIKISSKLDFYFHALITRLFDLHGEGSIIATLSLIRKIKKIRPDVIHLHNIHGYYINYPILFDYISKYNIPTVWTFHDCWAITGHCTHFDSIGCKRWLNGCCNCPQKKEYPKSIWLDNSKHNYSKKKSAFTSVKNLTILTVSNWLKDMISQSFLSNCQIKVIHNGIDINVFKPIPTDEHIEYRQRGYVLLGVATEWGPGKGLNEFIELSKNPNYQVILVGITKDVEPLLSKEIIAVNKTTNVQELVKIYNSADLFVNPTYNDSYPTVNLESISCGTPVITYRTGGSPESLYNNPNDYVSNKDGVKEYEVGSVVEKGDFLALCNGIERYRTDSSENKAIRREKCREWALENFDKDIRFKDYIKLYESILNK